MLDDDMLLLSTSSFQNLNMSLGWIGVSVIEQTLPITIQQEKKILSDAQRITIVGKTHLCNKQSLQNETIHLKKDHFQDLDISNDIVYDQSLCHTNPKTNMTEMQSRSFGNSLTKQATERH